jgi:hypothetical protein
LEKWNQVLEKDEAANEVDAELGIDILGGQIGDGLKRSAVAYKKSALYTYRRGCIYPPASLITTSTFPNLALMTSAAAALSFWSPEVSLMVMTTSGCLAASWARSLSAEGTVL